MLTKPSILARISAAAVLALSLAAMAQNPPAGKPAAPPPAPPTPAAPPASAPAEDNDPLVYVVMSTSKGDMAIELDRQHAPISVANFLKYVDAGFYDNTIFHRVIGTFMIQGGGFTADMVEKPANPPIKNEWNNGLKNLRGTIAMARRPDPDSATCQFFINTVDNPALDEPRGGAAYAVFGKVVANMDAVEAIKSVPTTVKGNYQNVPIDPVVIKSVKRITRADAEAMAAAKNPKTPAAPQAPAAPAAPVAPAASKPAKPAGGGN